MLRAWNILIIILIIICMDLIVQQLFYQTSSPLFTVTCLVYFETLLRVSLHRLKLVIME